MRRTAICLFAIALAGLLAGCPPNGKPEQEEGQEVEQVHCRPDEMSLPALSDSATVDEAVECFDKYWELCDQFLTKEKRAEQQALCDALCKQRKKDTGDPPPACEAETVRSTVDADVAKHCKPTEDAEAIKVTCSVIYVCPCDP